MLTMNLYVYARKYTVYTLIDKYTVYKLIHKLHAHSQARPIVGPWQQAGYQVAVSLSRGRPARILGTKASTSPESGGRSLKREKCAEFAGYIENGGIFILVNVVFCITCAHTLRKQERECIQHIYTYIHADMDVLIISNM
jgi:hypothetical protein